MNSGNIISEELKSMGSSLAGITRAMPYAVPPGYFDGLATDINKTIEDIHSAEQVPAWGKTMPYTLPDGYFATLTNNIVAATANSNVSAALPKAMPLQTPVGYFEGLPAKMLQAAKANDKETKKAKIIAFDRRIAFKNIRWAAAAMLILSIGIGSYQLSQNGEEQPESMLSSVSNNEIHDYLQQSYRVDVDRVISNTDITNMQLDNKEIIQYLDETGWDATE